MRAALLVVLIATPIAAPLRCQAAQKAGYITKGMCAGLPRVPVATPEGLCLGLVASGFKFPRGILPLGNGDLLVADMGGWTARRGSLWLLQRSAAGYRRHAAPLGMTYYFGSSLPTEYRGALIVAYHGYRATGNRLVAFVSDARGVPTGKSLELAWDWDAA